MPSVAGDVECPINGCEDITEKLAKDLVLCDTEELLDRLNKLECPMTWGDIGDAIDDVWQHELSVKIEDWDYTLNGIPHLPLNWNIGVVLALATVYCREEKHADAVKVILDSFQRDKQLSVIVKTKYKALSEFNDEIYGVAYATLAWLYFKMNCRNECVKYIRMAEEAYKRELEHLYLYLRSDVMKLFSRKGINKAMSIINRVLRMKDHHAYHYAAGSLMGKIRHFTKPWFCPTPKELNHLKIAYEKEPSTGNSVALVRCYHDISKRSFGEERDKNYQFAAALTSELLKEDLEQLPGGFIAKLLFWLLSPKLECSEALLKAAELSLERRPHCIQVNDYIGRFYLHFKMYEKAIPCLEESSKVLSYNVGLLLVCKYRLNQNDDFESTIQYYEERFRDCIEKKVDLYGILVEFYCFIYKNIEKVSSYFLELCRYGDPEKLSLHLSIYKAPLIEVLRPLMLNSKVESQVVSDCISKLKEMGEKKRYYRQPQINMGRIISGLI